MTNEIQSEKPILLQIHDAIHALRKVQNYKPTEFEKEISMIISEAFAPGCAECKFKYEMIKIEKYQGKKGFLRGLFGGGQ